MAVHATYSGKHACAPNSASQPVGNLFMGNLTPPSPSVMHSIDAISGMHLRATLQLCNSATFAFENFQRYVFWTPAAQGGSPCGSLRRLLADDWDLFKRLIHSQPTSANQSVTTKRRHNFFDLFYFWAFRNIAICLNLNPCTYSTSQSTSCP